MNGNQRKLDLNGDGSDEVGVPQPLSPESPYLWPETRVLNGSLSYASNPVFDSAVDKAKAVFGVLHSLTDVGLSWIDTKLNKNPNLKLRLLLAVYPACPTSSDVLRGLLERCNQTNDRVRVRLHPGSRTEDRPSSNLCIVSKSGSGTMVVSPTGDFCLGESRNERLHLCFPTDTALHQQFTAWFDYQWFKAARLDRHAISMPDLVPAQSDPDAERQWQSFLTDLTYNSQPNGDANDPETSDVKIAVDPETGDVKVSDLNGKPVQSVLDEADIPRPSVALVQVGKILHQGSLATIDNASRVPPLDCPISAGLLGIEADRRTGTVSRKTKFSVSAIDEKTLKKLEAYRKRTRVLLNKMSYPLADGARWVPHTARPLLEQELERVNQEGQKLLGDTVGTSVEAFVKSREKQVAKDAQTEYAELHPKQKLPEDVLQKILTELTNRLNRATGGKLLPMLSFLDVRVATAPDSDWSSQASQAFRFLMMVAKYPRECLTDSFFLRGLRIKSEQLLPAMDVVGDHLVATYVSDKTGIDLAHHELGVIEAIQKAEVEDMVKCDALYRLVKGATDEQINRLLAGEPSTDSNDNAKTESQSSI